MRAPPRNEIPIIIGGQFWQLSLTFVTSMLVARMLSADGYGLANLLRSLFTTFSVVAPLGLDVAMLKFWGRHKNDARFAATVSARLRAVAFGLSAAVFVFVLLGRGVPLTYIYKYPGFGPLLAVTFIALPLAGDVSILGAIHKAQGKAAQYALAALYLQPSVRLALLLLAWRFAPTVGSVVWINTLQIGVVSLTLFMFQLRIAPAPDSGTPKWERGVRRGDVCAEASRVLREASWMCLSVFAFNMMRVVDVLFLGAFVTSRELGEYAALSTMAQLIQFYPLAASQSLGPAVSELYHRGDLVGLRRELGGYMDRASLASGFMFGGLAVYGERLDLLFGASFVFGSVMCFLLPLANLLSGMLAPTGYALSMTGKHRAESWILFGGMAILVAACTLLVPRFGQVGAAAAAAISYCILNGVRFRFVAAHIGFYPGSWENLVPPLVALILAAGSKVLTDAIGARTIAMTAISVCIYTITYSGALFLTRKLRAFPDRL